VVDGLAKAGMIDRMQSNEKTIEIGSANPVKIQSALSGFEVMFPEVKFIAKGVAVASGVSDQPMSCSETLLGATNRARELRSQSAADYVVGIEGGIEVIDNELFAGAWIVVIDSDGKVARGRSASFALPPQVKEMVDAGIELGDANDKMFKERNSKQAGGAVGSLTTGVITRQSLYEHAMALALIPFQQPSLFDGPAIGSKRTD
jgi:inosine/xanthosine triphosphatase